MRIPQKKVLNYQYNKQMALKIQMESSKYLEVGYETNSQDSGKREYLDSAFVYRCGLWFHGCFSAVEKAPVSCLAVFELQLFALSDSRHVAHLTCEICEIESKALVCVFACGWHPAHLFLEGIPPVSMGDIADGDGRAIGTAVGHAQAARAGA